MRRQPGGTHRIASPAGSRCGGTGGPARPRDTRGTRTGRGSSRPQAGQRACVGLFRREEEWGVRGLGIPKITDFGLAKRMDVTSSETRTEQIMGTPSYMAPNRPRGKAGKSDRPPTFTRWCDSVSLADGPPPLSGRGRNRDDAAGGRGRASASASGPAHRARRSRNNLSQVFSKSNRPSVTRARPRSPTICGGFWLTSRFWPNRSPGGGDEMVAAPARDCRPDWRERLGRSLTAGGSFAVRVATGAGTR